MNNIEVDVIIVARGGGSFEDLWPFNEENVARAIFRSNVPIISGIGHETDFTISDFVADKRAHTPSAAAELAVPDIIEIKNNILHLERQLIREFTRIREIDRQRLEYIKNRPVFRRPKILIEQYIQLIDDKKDKLVEGFINKIEFIKGEIAGIEGKLNALSPKATLKRGYSITMKGTKVIKSKKDIKSKEIISTIVSDGKIRSRVE